MIREEIAKQSYKIKIVIGGAKTSAYHYWFSFTLIYLLAMKPKEVTSLKAKDFNLGKGEIFIRGKWFKIKDKKLFDATKDFIAGKSPGDLIFSFDYQRLERKFKFYAKLFNSREIKLDDVRWIKSREMYVNDKTDVYSIAKKFGFKNIAYLESKIGG